MNETEYYAMRKSGSDAIGPEAVAFAIDLGICIGRECPRAAGGCDPRCPALQAWIGSVSNG